MGVTQLWQALEPAKKTIPLQSLDGAIVCVDLSTWLFEAQTQKALQGVYTHPHLWVVFTRTCALLRNGIRPIVVVEGRSSKLKGDTLRKRYGEDVFVSSQVSHGVGGGGFSHGGGGASGAFGRNAMDFRRWCSESVRVLEAMGIPCVQSDGEGEATCARLEATYLLDGVITLDGDAFLFGSKCIFKNVQYSKPPLTVDKYHVDEISKLVGGDVREKLIGLALLVGSDYTEGVPMVGLKTSMKFLAEFGEGSVLETFRVWKREGFAAQPLPQVDEPPPEPEDGAPKKKGGRKKKPPKPKPTTADKVRERASKVPNFPSENVISAYFKEGFRGEILGNSRLPHTWVRPDLPRLFRLFGEYFTWSHGTTLVKFRPVMAAFDSRWGQKEYQAVEIVKSKTTLDQPFYVVAWDCRCPEQKALDLSVIGTVIVDGVAATTRFETTETVDFMQKVYPDLVRAYESAQEAKRQAKAEKEAEKLRAKERKKQKAGVQPDGKTQLTLDMWAQKRKVPTEIPRKSEKHEHVVAPWRQTPPFIPSVSVTVGEDYSLPPPAKQPYAIQKIPHEITGANPDVGTSTSTMNGMTVRAPGNTGVSKLDTGRQHVTYANPVFSSGAGGSNAIVKGPPEKVQRPPIEPISIDDDDNEIPHKPPVTTIAFVQKPPPKKETVTEKPPVKTKPVSKTGVPNRVGAGKATSKDTAAAGRQMTLDQWAKLPKTLNVNINTSPTKKQRINLDESKVAATLEQPTTPLSNRKGADMTRLGVEGTRQRLDFTGSAFGNWDSIGIQQPKIGKPAGAVRGKLDLLLGKRDEVGDLCKMFPRVPREQVVEVWARTGNMQAACDLLFNR